MYIFLGGLWLYDDPNQVGPAIYPPSSKWSPKKPELLQLKSNLAISGAPRIIYIIYIQS